MSIKTLDSNQARNHWREMLDTVLSSGTDVVITRYNKPIVSMVAYEDYLAVQEELQRHRAERQAIRRLKTESLATMIASERILAREWDTPEEDAAWADL
ncbi:MAG: type II toxin-antitoxin system Phd/YefM family antitoxin [Anaerolineales bacterium]|nr:type II toxin-antitoxin system Phd/YefM family antitoxin [Anaerolineales bacterium]